MAEKNKYTSLIWAAAGLYIAFEGYRLQLGTLKSPGSGFLVFWTGIMISALSVALFISSLRKKGEQRTLWKGTRWATCVKLMVSLFVYALIFKEVGFLLSTFLLLLFLFKGLEPQRWSVAILSAGITAVSCYLLFGVLMETQLPKGILENAFARLYHLLLGAR
jgi:putative tricarboxylic transport membrane protein